MNRRGETQSRKTSAGVRRIGLDDVTPDARIVINGVVFNLGDLAAGRTVLDVGCGGGRHRSTVEEAGGRWIGMEPFVGGSHSVMGEAAALPFGDASIDLVIMDAVLEHIPDVSTAFAEVARVLKSGGKFVGYAAFMESFHEISYHHLSFKAIEHLVT